MPDPTISAIDRFFDFVDEGVEKLDHVLNRRKHTEQRARRINREVIDTEPSSPPKTATPKTTAPTKTDTPCAGAPGLVRKPRFYIVESVSNGSTLFVVTDGGKARTECSTREFAEKILKALEAAT